MAERTSNPTLNGIGVSRGVAQGKILLCRAERIRIPDEPAEDPALETSRFTSCVQAVSQRIARDAERFEREDNALRKEILEAHLEILEDEESLIEPVLDAIRTARKNAPAAVQNTLEAVAATFELLESDYMRQRAADIRDLKDQLLRELLGLKGTSLSDLSEPVILLAADIAPSDAISLDRKNVLGIVCEEGGKTSHTAVLANAMGVPAVMGCTGLLSAAQNAGYALLNGDTGEVVLDPDAEQLAQFSEKEAAARAQETLLNAFLTAPTLTKDGEKRLIFSNIASPDESKLAYENGCEGIGLFRSEFLYCSAEEIPDEGAQYKAYLQALRFAKGLPVTVRTLDAGGDKPIASLNMPHEENPFLGRRAIRLCLEEDALFRTQLRALLRAAAEGEIRIMFPMVASVSEVRQAKEQLALARKELADRGIAVPQRVPIGIMVEVPSAVVMADELAEEVDFFSIGTNDLTQYVLAADRGNKYVSSLYSHYDPAVIRMIAHTIQAAHRHGICCGMCGEAAGDALFSPLLLGLGLDEFSVAPRSVLPLREQFSRLESSVCQALAQRVLALPDKAAVIKELQAFSLTYRR